MTTQGNIVVVQIYTCPVTSLTVRHWIKQESAKPLRTRLKVDEYAEKKWNSSTWFTVVTMTFLGKHLDKELIILRQKCWMNRI